ncbi:MAG: AI-2E family transporter [Bdellovibrionaceae bacterium]|nr:AI-2E family transporter [Bdellovibrio sp.]
MTSSRPPASQSFNDRKLFDVAPSFFVKIALFAFTIFLVFKLAKLGLLFFIAILIAVSLNPLVDRLQKYKLPRYLAIGLVTLLLGSVLMWVGLGLAPAVYAQLQVIVAALPNIQEQILSEFPPKSLIGRIFFKLSISGDSDPNLWLDPAINFLRSTMHVLTEFFMILIMAVYLLIDGKRAFIWFSDFFSAPVRLKLRATAVQTAPVVSSYLSAQIFTSFLCGVFSFTLLTTLKVPAALTLAAVAAILDVMPILGFLMTLVPATVLALTVSPATAGIVLIAYGLYHTFEVYILLPIIYRRNLKLRTLVMLISVLVAWTLGGILLAMAILPVVASYPIIEKIWLAKYLGRHVIQKHIRGDESLADMSNDTLSIWNDPLLNFSESRSYNPVDRRILRALGRTILIVDDDLDTRALLKDILETEGFRVLEAGNGQDGLDYLKNHAEIGLILLDYRMPVMDGLTFFEKTRKMKNVNHIPVVFLSADADHIKTLESGAAEIIRKPVDFDHLMSLIHRHYHSPSTDFAGASSV